MRLLVAGIGYACKYDSIVAQQQPSECHTRIEFYRQLFVFNVATQSTESDFAKPKRPHFARAFVICSYSSPRWRAASLVPFTSGRSTSAAWETTANAPLEMCKRELP